MNDAATQLLAVVLVATWCGFGLYGILRRFERSPSMRELLLRFRRARLSTKAAVVAGLAGVVAVGGTKPGGGNGGGLRGGSAAPADPPPEPAFGLVEVRTNAVALRAESATAVEIADWRQHGSSAGGVWIDVGEPFFRIGTSLVSRAYVTAGGVLSFDTARHPAPGAPLPDGTGLPALAPLLAPLGMVPEANWTNAGASSRFWHDAAPDRGRVFTWEDALLDRLSGRRVSVQAELRPSGDFTYRYDFRDALDPPATNLVIGAQAGTNGVNALAVLGTNLLGATVWRVDGAPAGAGGVAVADLLCTNGVLRAPARFALEWTDASGAAPNADADGDGLSDWDEVFRFGTDPAQADTDGDGLSDGAERLAGTDPRDADEDGDGVPDGVSPSDWAANPLWTESAASSDFSVVLASDLPAGTAASLVLGDLTIPLSTAGSWNIDLPAGEMVDVRLFSTGQSPVPLSLLPVRDGGNRGGAGPARGGSPRFRDDPDGVFEGGSRGGAARLAEPTMRIVHEDGTDAFGNECIHDGSHGAGYLLEILPAGTGITSDDADLVGFTRRSGGVLHLYTAWMPKNASVVGSASITEPLDYGTLYDEVWVHDCEGDEVWWCRYCRMFHASENGCRHDPDCPFGSNPSADCTCPTRVVRVSEGTNVYELATCFVGVASCCCPPVDAATGAVLDSVDGNLVVRNSAGVLAPGDRFEGPVVVSATAVSGAAPSEIRYHLVGETQNGTPTNLASRVAKVWAVRITHEPVTMDRDGTAFYNPCGIVNGGTATFRLSLAPAAFPDSAIVWSAEPQGRIEPVSGNTGRTVSFRGLTNGTVRIGASIAGYDGPPPVFNAGVVTSAVVRVKAFVVEDEHGHPVRAPETIAPCFPAINEIFTQVGVRFVLEPLIEHVVNTNFLDLRKENGTYPQGHLLVSHTNSTGCLELYFTRSIEGAHGLQNSSGLIVAADADARVLAHELGHSCGLADVLDYFEWKRPGGGANAYDWIWDWSRAARDRAPFDWGTDADEGYYDLALHRQILGRMLMCGRRTATGEDITFGDVKGLIPVSDTAPPVDGTCATGFFTPPMGRPTISQ